MTEIDTTAPETVHNDTEAGNVVPLTPTAPEPTPSERIVGFVKKHPVLTVAGGLVAGVAISALLPRKAGRKLLGNAVHLAEAAGAATMMFGRETGHKAQNLGVEARHKAGELASRAEKGGHATAERLEKYGLAALAAASALGRATAKRAADTSHHVMDAASDLRHRVKH